MHRGAVLVSTFLTPRLYLIFFSATTQKELVLGLENLQVGYILKPRHTQSESVFFFLALCPLVLPRTPPSHLLVPVM